MKYRKLGNIHSTSNTIVLIYYNNIVIPINPHIYDTLSSRVDPQLPNSLTIYIVLEYITTFKLNEVMWGCRP